MHRKQVDWEQIETEFRSGSQSLRSIARAAGLTHVAITKRAKKHGWERKFQPVKAVPVAAPGTEIVARPSHGFVYVIYLDAPGDRSYKIGMASSLMERLSAHQCASPYQVCIACAYFTPDSRAEEQALHLMFDDKRVRGEWFSLSADDLQLIAQRALLV